MQDERLLAGRVVVVTGAGRGLGRAYALELARAGARVLVNDSGVGPAGEGRSPEPSLQVAAEIAAAGGQALADAEDVGDWSAARRIVAKALEAFGRLDAVVNNAGIVREESFVRLEESAWDEVVRVHLKGHAALAAAAAAHWHEVAHRDGPSDWRIVNTTSPLALSGSAGPAAYVASKGAIASLTAVEAAELCRYGVTANAIAPAARTRLTEAVGAAAVAVPANAKAFDSMDPDNVAPLVAWLCSVDSRGVNGRVFEVQGGRVSLMAGWHRAASFDRGSRVLASELRPVVEGLIAQAPEYDLASAPGREAPVGGDEP